MWRTLLVTGLLLTNTPAFAQSEKSTDEAVSGTPETDAAKGETRPGAARALACRQAGQRQGLRGPALLDHVQVCVLEARLACLKQAIAEKAYGPQRKTVIEACLDKPS